MKVHNIEITHHDKILFPESNITKLEVVKYYEKFANKIIKFLIDRPVSLVRNPAGINQRGFYQRHPNENFPEYIERVKIIEKSGQVDTYIAIDQIEDLIYLSNLGVLEYHAWLSKISDIEHPDTLIFDLDPDKDADWKKVIDAAHWLNSRLKEDGFRPEARVSGGKGIHVVANYNKQVTWEDSKEYTKQIAEELVNTNKVYMIDLSKEKRSKRIFIDFYRNQRGSTAIVPYSLRARANAPICMKIDWKDLNYTTKPDSFKLKMLV
jgi:bifunctional non-homologous end joining protein LigD